MKVTGKQELPKCVSLSTGKVFKKVAFKRLRFCPIHIDYIWQKGLIFKVDSVSIFRVDPTLKSIKEKMLAKEAEEREKEEAKSGMVTN